MPEYSGKAPKSASHVCFCLVFICNESLQKDICNLVCLYNFLSTNFKNEHDIDIDLFFFIQNWERGRLFSLEEQILHKVSYGQFV